MLDCDRSLLCRGAETIPLGRRGLALLKSLLANGGSAVSKEQLRADVWPGLVVEDVNLSVQVANLRKALGRKPDGQEWIVTVPRFGYQLVSEERWGRSTAVPMLAVLPFENLSGEATRQHLVYGLTDELVSALSRFRSFGVLSRGAWQSHDELASKDRPEADYLLEGSMQAQDDDIRVVVTLSDRHGYSLWSDRFIGRLDAPFDFEDRVVQRVASIIEPRIQSSELSRSRRMPPASLDAYDLYLRGVASLRRFDEPSNAEAISLLDKAISIEPENGAYLGFACWAREIRYSWGWPMRDQDLGRCVELANKAIERASDDATVLARCGIALQLVGLEYKRGLAVAERAAALNPNNAVALVSAGLAHFLGGNLDRALQHLHHCIALQPDDAFEAMGIAANVYCALGQHEEALTWAGRGLAVNAAYQSCHWVLVASSIHLGRLSEARAALDDLLTRAPTLTIAGLMRTGCEDRARERHLFDGLRAAGLPAA